MFWVLISLTLSDFCSLDFGQVARQPGSQCEETLILCKCFFSYFFAPSNNGPLGGVRKVISVPKCVSQTSEVPPCATAPTATNLNQQNRNIVKRPRAIIPKPKQNTAPPLTPTHSEEPDAHKIADRRTQPNKSKYITLQGNLLNLKVF